MRIRVVLPAPFSPSRACTSPRRIVRSTPSFATRCPKRLVIPRSSTSSSGSAGSTPSQRPPEWSARRNGRTRWGRLVDVDSERPRLDGGLLVLDLGQEIGWDASADRLVDRGQGGAALGHHAEV